VRVFAQTGVMARRNLLHVLSDPEQLIGITIQPLMFLLLFVFVFGGAISGSTTRYLEFVLPGLLVQGIGFGTTQTAIGLNADFQRGLIDRFRSLPMARSAVVAGRVTADIARTAWMCVITVGVGRRSDSGSTAGSRARSARSGWCWRSAWPCAG
jgi:ABC-2 type transporter